MRFTYGLYKKAAGLNASLIGGALTGGGSLLWSSLQEDPLPWKQRLKRAAKHALIGGSTIGMLDAMLANANGDPELQAAAESATDDPEVSKGWLSSAKDVLTGNWKSIGAAATGLGGVGVGLKNYLSGQAARLGMIRALRFNNSNLRAHGSKAAQNAAKKKTIALVKSENAPGLMSIFRKVFINPSKWRALNKNYN